MYLLPSIISSLESDLLAGKIEECNRCCKTRYTVHLPPASFLLLCPPYFKEVKTPTHIIIAKKPCFVEDEIHHGKN